MADHLSSRLRAMSSCDKCKLLIVMSVPVLFCLRPCERRSVDGAWSLTSHTAGRPAGGRTVTAQWRCLSRPLARRLCPRYRLRQLRACGDCYHCSPRTPSTSSWGCQLVCSEILAKFVSRKSFTRMCSCVFSYTVFQWFSTIFLQTWITILVLNENLLSLYVTSSLAAISPSFKID